VVHIIKRGGGISVSKCFTLEVEVGALSFAATVAQPQADHGTTSCR